MKNGADMRKELPKGSARAVVMQWDRESGRFLGLQGLAGNARQRRLAIRALRQEGKNVRVLSRH